MSKVQMEFRAFDDLPWIHVEGYPPGAEEKVLSRDPLTGDVTRLFRFPAGASMDAVLSHDFWEEVYLLEGDLVSGDKMFTEGMYACRPPGMLHGCCFSPKGSMSFEVRYQPTPRMATGAGKPEMELRKFDDVPWTQINGFPPGVHEKILARDSASGDTTKLVRLLPGARIERALTNDFWEEVYILEGDLVSGDKEFTKGMYACRPPGMIHGPYSSAAGCNVFQVLYYS